jgi:hypothetical protein
MVQINILWKVLQIMLCKGFWLHHTDLLNFRMFFISFWLYNSSLFNKFVCKLGLFFSQNASQTSVLKAHEYQKRPNLHTNELNTTFFCWTSPLKAPIRLKSLKLAWRFVLTSCDVYQNPFTQKKILKFWQCWTKKY